jgi:DNA polymerase alpha subunit A
VSKISPVDADGRIKFYWFDAFENTQVRSSSIYLFGRVLLPSEAEASSGTGKAAPPLTASCCLTIRNMERTIFVLPRTHKVVNINDESKVSDTAVNFSDGKLLLFFHTPACHL